MSSERASRTLSRGLAPIVERLEIERAEFVTSKEIATIAESVGLATPAAVLATRLRRSGWLLPTASRGIYEFSPGAHAGAVSRGSATLPLRAILASVPMAHVALTLQSAAWALGIADRNPSRLEVAAPDAATAARLSRMLGARGRVVVFKAILPLLEARGVPTLSAESVLVSMARRPADVRSWSSAMEWLPELAAACSPDRVLRELSDRPQAVSTRMGYLLAGLRPSLSERLAPQSAAKAGTVYFGPRRSALRFNRAFQVADSILPVDPQTLAPVGD